MGKGESEELRIDSTPQGGTAASGGFALTRPRRGSDETDAFLRAVVRLGASDLHLKSGQSPRLRIGGELRALKREAAPTEEYEARVFSLLTEEERQKLLTEGSVDFAYDLDDEVRFRFNVYRQESGLSVAVRVVPRQIPSFDDLHLPPSLAGIADARRGLVLTSGVTGSGKSTTIAAMIEHVNCTRSDHIVTIEDPIEFLYTPKKALVNQREVGINVKDFPTALRALLREDPDVVLIGEMRDAPTFRAALQAADTGHLVFGTVHASGAAETMGRILSFFDEEERIAVRQSMAANLRAVICQKLLPSIVKGVRRVPALEILHSTPTVRKMISEGREIDLGVLIRAGEDDMVGFTESLYELIDGGLIDEETGCLAAPSAELLQMRLSGIKPSKQQIVG